MKINYNPEDPRITSGKNISFWTDTAIMPPLNPLKENLETDVVIVGGGIAGLTTAYCLAQSGKKVVLIEDGFIGSGETGRTTAQLATALDNRYYQLEKNFGKQKTKWIAESHKLAIDLVESIIKKENINCGFERVNGYLFLHPSDKDSSLQKELKAASEAGVAVSAVDEVPGMPQMNNALRFMNQAQFHPLNYLNGLKEAIEKSGVRVFTGTHASKINHEGIITAEGFIVKAQYIVVATNSPVNDLVNWYEKQTALRTYVIGGLVERGLLPHALWWDTGDFKTGSPIPPYHYVRVHPYNDKYDLLISGGEDHPTGKPGPPDTSEENRYRILEEWTQHHFPIKDIKYHWSGQVMEPVDGLAFIGSHPVNPDHIFIISGDSGKGMTHCSFAGLLITDLILGRMNKWEKLYSPSRFNLKEGDKDMEWSKGERVKLLKGKTDTEEKELQAIRTGEAKIIKIQGKKCGAYRDETGRLNVVSAECTHLKCIVSWNNDEKSWDCPCHGSRFTYQGKVINGPANSDLPGINRDDLVLENKNILLETK